MKKTKNFMIGVLVGALIMSVPAFAADIWDRIDVVRNKIIVMIGGEKLEADNFLYNDTTYVPIRKVAEGLGMNVTFKDGVAYIDERYAAEFGGEKIDVGGFEATTGELADYITLYTKAPETQGMSADEIKVIATDYLIKDKAMEALAVENGFVVGKEFYDNFSKMISYMELNYGSKEAMEKAMNDAGYTYNMYKRYQELEYLYSKLVQSGLFRPTDAEVESYYVSNKSQFAYDGVQAKHILISTMDENGNAITDAAKLKTIENKANSVYKQAIGGADFDELIKKYGEDPGMEQNPEGYIFTRGEMVTEFENAAFALKDGAISEPVKTTYGWHIILKVKAITEQPLDDALRLDIADHLTVEKINMAINTKLIK